MKQITRYKSIEDCYEENWLQLCKIRDYITIDTAIKLWEMVFQKSYEDKISQG